MYRLFDRKKINKIFFSCIRIVILWKRSDKLAIIVSLKVTSIVLKKVRVQVLSRK